MMSIKQAEGTTYRGFHDHADSNSSCQFSVFAEPEFSRPMLFEFRPWGTASSHSRRHTARCSQVADVDSLDIVLSNGELGTVSSLASVQRKCRTNLTGPLHQHNRIVIGATSNGNNEVCLCGCSRHKSKIDRGRTCAVHRQCGSTDASSVGLYDLAKDSRGAGSKSAIPSVNRCDCMGARRQRCCREGPDPRATRCP